MGTFGTSLIAGELLGWGLSGSIGPLLDGVGERGAHMREFGCAVLLVFLSCAPTTHPVLDVTLSSRQVVDASPVRVRVVATNAAGKIGTGKVKIVSKAGSLADPVEVELDSFGTAAADLICDPRSEPACAESVRVSATWTSDQETVSAEATLNSGGVVPGGSGGGAGGGGAALNFDGTSDVRAVLASCPRVPKFDEVTLYGSIAALGPLNIHFTHGSSSGGAPRPTGVALITRKGSLPDAGTGTPVVDWVGPILFGPATGVVLDTVYTATTNSRTSQADNVDLRVNAVRGSIEPLSCPEGAGSGKVIFRRLKPYMEDFDGGWTSGAFTFECPDAGMSVAGCFDYL